MVVDGFAVSGMARAGVRAVGLANESASFVTIRNVTASNNGRWGIFTGHVDDLLIENNRTSGSLDEHGIYVSNSGDRPIVRNNIAWSNNGSGIQLNADESQGGDGIITQAVISGNVIYDNGRGGGSGINLDGVQDSLIENNLLYQNHASGISLFQIDGGGPSTGNRLINNTIHQADDGRWALNLQDGAANTTVLNNILLSDHSFRGAIDASSDSLLGLDSDFNVVIPRFTSDDEFLTFTQWQSRTGGDAHSIVASVGELFVNASIGNYHLLPDASAVDRGTAEIGARRRPGRSASAAEVGLRHRCVRVRRPSGRFQQQRYDRRGRLHPVARCDDSGRACIAKRPHARLSRRDGLRLLASALRRKGEMVVVPQRALQSPSRERW